MVNVRYWHLTDDSIDLTAACPLMPKSIAINKRDRCVWH
jgi:hypothetical protein